MSKNKSLYLLVSIFIFGLSIRLVGLGKIPSGFTPDEAVQGYSAYSLLQTGRDEWDSTWPVLSFRSFLDYKAPLQTYLMMPSIAVFGLGQFAVRLPSAIFGSLAIIAIYFLAWELFKKREIGLLAAATFAITPWAMQFSRMALEANLISFFFPLGLWAFLRGLRLQNTNYYLLTTIAWGLSLFTYHSVKLFLPLFCLGLLIFCFKQIRAIPFKNLLFPLLVFAVFVAPIYQSSVFGRTSARGGDLLVTNFSVEDLSVITNDQFYSPFNKISPILPRIFSNRLTFVLDRFAKNYVSYLTPDFWFTSGGTETTYAIVPGSGLLNLWQLPFIGFALYFLITKYKDHPLVNKVMFLWLFLSPLPAAITKEGFRPNRASMFLGFWALLTAYGIYLVFSKLPERLNSLLRYFLFPVVLVSFVFWANNFAFLAPINFPGYMNEGWRETVAKLQEIQGNYSHVYIQRGSQSQAFIAFYQALPPRIFQTASAAWSDKIAADPSIKYLDQLGSYSLDKFTFRLFSWPENIDYQSVYVATGFDLLPASRHTLYQYKTKTGQQLTEIFDFKKNE